MGIHIGQIIRKQLDAAGMSKTEFARRINTTSQNVYGIFKRKSIDTALLQKISEVLRYDFFQYYSTPGAVIVEDGKKDYKQSQTAPEDIPGLLKEVENLRKENAYLKEINQLLREKVKVQKSK